jgi:hypothetical protein
MTLLQRCWRWFGQQSRLNKVVIVGFSSALVLFLVPMVVSWFKPTPIHVGVAFYTYERAFLLEGNTKTYFYQKRNLVSDCSLRRIEQTLPKGRARTPDPQSWVLSKFLLENVSDQNITKLRMNIRSPLLGPTTQLFTTPNVEATGELDATAKDGLHRYVQVPFLSADQFGTFPLKIARTNAMKILNREGILRTGDETFANEKIEFTMLRSDEPDVKDELVPYRLLPKARVCQEGMAGDW